MKKTVNNKNIKVMRKKGVQLLAAAALTAALLGGQVHPSFAGGSSTSVETVSLIPENVTIDSPTELYNVGLPGNEYGTLSWADGSYVPSSRVQSCKVILTPTDSADLSGFAGWDEETGTVTGYVTVVVSSIQEPAAEAPAGDDSAEGEEGSEATATPALTVTPGVPGEGANGADSEKKEQQSEDSENKDSEAGNQDIKKNDEKSEDSGTQGDAAPAEQIGASDGVDGDISDPADEEDKPEDIFERPIEQYGEDSRPTTVEDTLTDEEKAARGAENHSCAGISVWGINLPWYVQFRATSGDSYQFTNQEDAAIFQSYEFELWDLKNDTEYIIPDGEYISVTVSVKEGYDYIIEHLLDNGAMETIVPSVDGNTMVFSTHSFSPFGIAGSKPLVGGDIAENSYPESQEQLGTSDISGGQQSTITATPAQGTADTSNITQAPGSTDSDEQSESSSSSKAVNTGDTTNIYPFVILLVVAVIFVGVIIYLKKRK